MFLEVAGESGGVGVGALSGSPLASFPVQHCFCHLSRLFVEMIKAEALVMVHICSRLTANADAHPGKSVPGVPVSLYPADSPPASCYSRSQTPTSLQLTESSI